MDWNKLKTNIAILLISIQLIDSSPFQKRKYIYKIKLKELAESIEKDGLIEPVIARPKKIVTSLLLVNEDLEQ